MKKLLVVLMLLLVVWVLVLPYVPPTLLYSDDIDYVEIAIKDIEEYKNTTGKYPSKSQAVDLKPNMFYQPLGDSYQIGFSIGFDEIYIYDSKLDKWSFEIERGLPLRFPGSRSE